MEELALDPTIAERHAFALSDINRRFAELVSLVRKYNPQPSMPNSDNEINQQNDFLADLQSDLDQNQPDSESDYDSLFRGHTATGLTGTLPITKNQKQTEEEQTNTFLNYQEDAMERSSDLNTFIYAPERQKLRRHIAAKGLGMVALAKNQTQEIAAKASTRFQRLKSFSQEIRGRLYEPILTERSTDIAAVLPDIRLDMAKKAIGGAVLAMLMASGTAAGLEAQQMNAKEKVTTTAEQNDARFTSKKTVIATPQTTTTTTIQPTTTTTMKRGTVCYDPTGVTKRGIQAPTDRVLDNIAYLIDKGAVPAMAKRLIGNFDFESEGLNPTQPGDGGEALGYAQWHPGRRSANFPLDGHGQLNYALNEMRVSYPFAYSVMHDPNASRAQFEEAMKQYEGYRVAGDRYVRGDILQAVDCK